MDWIYQTRDCAPWNCTEPYTLFCVCATCDSFSSHSRCSLHSSRRSLWLSHLLCLSLGQGEISSFHRVSLVNSNHFSCFTQIIMQFPCVNVMETYCLFAQYCWPVSWNMYQKDHSCHSWKIIQLHLRQDMYRVFVMHRLK